jgi:long-chain acyl-CoA synthetase
VPAVHQAAQLTHRNLTVNAAQTVYGQRLDETSVLFNYMPTFHLMHLTIGVCALATHVLWDCADVAESIEVANRYRATHYYSLPMRLCKVALHPRLTELEAPHLRAIMSGGSTLPAAASIPLARPDDSYRLRRAGS